MYVPSEERGPSKVFSEDIKRFKSAAKLIAPITLALVIISALTLTGKMIGIAAGGSIVGLSSAVILFQIVTACRAKSSLKKRAALCAAFLPFVATIILGSMALTGALTLSAAAWTVCGSTAGLTGITLLVICCLGVSQRTHSKKMASQYQDLSEDPVYVTTSPYNPFTHYTSPTNRSSNNPFDYGYVANTGYTNSLEDFTDF